MTIMLFLAHRVKGINLQPRVCTDYRCVVYRNLEIETGVEYEIVNNLWKIK